MTEDDPVTGQAFACVSFVSPSDAVPRKDVFFFEKFVRDVFLPKATAFADAVAIAPEKVKAFVGNFKDDAKDVVTDFEAFCANNQARLDDEFSSMHPYELTTAGFKVRGSYPTIETARKRAEALRDSDASVDVFVAQVGAWCPFDPRAETVGEVVYQESELNTLMKLKKEADERKNEIYRAETGDRVSLAKREGQLAQIVEVDGEEECADDGDAESTASVDGFEKVDGDDLNEHRESAGV